MARELPKKPAWCMDLGRDPEEKTKRFCINSKGRKSAGARLPRDCWELGFTQGHTHIDTGS